MLFVHRPERYTAEEISHFLNARPEVVNWVRIFENVYAVEATVGRRSLHTALVSYCEKNGEKASAHAFFEFSAVGSGRLSKGIWSILNKMYFDNADGSAVEAETVTRMLSGAANEPTEE